MSTSTRITSSSNVSGVEIRKPAALAQIAKKFTPVILQEDDTPVPPSNADYFSRMNLPTNIELDSGNYAVIDVQPDFRFIKNYIEYHIASFYPEYNVKGHPNVSPLTLIGMCLTYVFAFLLACDCTFRPTKSHWAARFLSDQQKKDLYDVLLSAHVPTFLSDLLLQLSPVYDPRRSNIIYVPTLAGYSHLHDFGRTILPHIYYISHQILATTRTNAEPLETLSKVYMTRILTLGTQQFTAGNYFGQNYGNTHTNWVNSDFEAVFNPIVGRALTQKPTFGKFVIHPTTIADNASFDIYTLALLADDTNVENMSNMVNSISAFFHSHDAKSPKLGSILATLSGTLLFSHSIEPPTLPTWTATKTVTWKDTTTEHTDTQFADHIHFMVAKKAYTDKTDKADDTSKIDKSMYRLEKSTHDTDSEPVPVTLFSPKFHVAPYVLYFQPYDVSPSSLGLTIACGIKIELAEIDGFTVPTEHPESSLDDNNSQYLQSAIRLDRIGRPAHQAAPDIDIHIMERRQLDRTDQAAAVSFRDMSRNILSYFNTTNILSATIAGIFGYHKEPNHDNAAHAFTFTGGNNGIFTKMPENYVYGWSSYRIVHKHARPEPKDISMLLSFRPIHGTNVTLSRSKNPALLIPH
jgi:hypothetical protein